MSAQRTIDVAAWTLGVDLGTTATAAAIASDGKRRLVELDGRAAMPSTVLAPPEGGLVVGVAAEAQAALHPERVERTPKRRLVDPVMLLGDRAVEPVEAIAAVLGHVTAAATAQMGGTPPSALVLTHPAPWGAQRIDVLRDAARRCGLPEPELVSEPIAAAAQLALDLAAPGDLLAVYDLGGGTLDVAIVRRTETGFEVAGPPGGDDALGGESLDERIVRALLDRLDPAVAEQLRSSAERSWQQARLQLRRDARGAKEALSSTASFQWYSGSPLDTEFRLSAAELDELVAEPVTQSITALLEVVRRSGLHPGDLHSVVMVGGSARAPIVGRLLTEAIGRAPVTWGDPKAAVCLGALVVAGARPATHPAASTATGVSPHARPPAVSDPPGAENQATETPVIETVETVVSAEPAEPAGSARNGTLGTIDSPDRGQPAEMAVPPHGLVGTATEPAAGIGGWSRERIGATIGIGLVSLGIVSAILAALAR